MYSVGRVTSRPTHDVSLECEPTGGGSCSSPFEGQMPLPSKVVPDYRPTKTQPTIASRRSVMGVRADGADKSSLRTTVPSLPM